MATGKIKKTVKAKATAKTAKTTAKKAPVKAEKAPAKKTAVKKTSAKKTPAKKTKTLDVSALPDPFEVNEKTDAPRTRDIYTNHKAAFGKALPKGAVYDIGTADGFLSMNFTMFLNDNIPQAYMSDPDAVDMCIKLCALAWNLGVLGSGKKSEKTASAFRKACAATPEFKKISKALGKKNFDSTLDLLVEAKNDDFPKYTDIIKSWNIESVEEGECECECGCDHHEEEDFIVVRINAKGCSPDMITSVDLK